MGLRNTIFAPLALIFLLLPGGEAARADEPEVSPATQDCLVCHVSATPGMVADWKKSRHARITPSRALEAKELERRVSASQVPAELLNFVVGCAECHTMNPDSHKDSFEHGEKKVHLTVTPKDCARCHPVERDQYQRNIMSQAHGNLANNSLYGTLMTSINGVQSLEGLKTVIAQPDEKTSAESCFSCHGTALEVKGFEKRESDFGDMEFPIIAGWPNQGVGRLNPDGSKGSCSSCHSRHQFSIKMARKPYTCSQCHKGPDVPAYKAYSVSKHGNLFSSLNGEWNFEKVPWTVGKDFNGPTCAACHVSLLENTEGAVVAKRSHQMNDRLPWRILGLIYSHAHPKSPDTSIIKNKDGLPLPTTFSGEPAVEFLIGADEQEIRKKNMQAVCLSCHTSDWVKGHWERFENTMKTTDAMTLTATRIMQRAWDEKLADPANPFDEALEKLWVEQWLFYANSTRSASAMLGADYGVFANGRWYLSKNIQDMMDYLTFSIEPESGQ